MWHYDMFIFFARVCLSGVIGKMVLIWVKGYMNSVFLKKTWTQFVWVFFVPLANYLLIWKCHHCRWRDRNFDLYSALMTIEQWGLFNVPHLLCHGPTFIMVIFKDTYTCCQAFSGGAVFTGLNFLGLARFFLK